MWTLNLFWDSFSHLNFYRERYSHFRTFNALGIIFTGILYLFSFCAFSQNPKHFPPKFQNLSLKEGLSNLSVHAITQDDLGYIWIATARGLNRYDGISFKQFYDGEKENSLYHNFVSNLFRNHKGYLFCASDGLSFYDPNTDELENFEPNIKINHFCDYNKQTFGTQLQGGLLIIHPEQKKIIPVDSFPQNTSMNSLFATENQGIWCVNHSNTLLYNYSPEKNSYHQ